MVQVLNHFKTLAKIAGNITILIRIRSVNVDVIHEINTQWGDLLSLSVCSWMSHCLLNRFSEEYAGKDKERL
jgi:hypothetical protein